MALLERICESDGETPSYRSVGVPPTRVFSLSETLKPRGVARASSPVRCLGRVKQGLLERDAQATGMARASSSVRCLSRVKQVCWSETLQPQGCA